MTRTVRILWVAGWLAVSVACTPPGDRQSPAEGVGEGEALHHRLAALKRELPGLLEGAAVPGLVAAVVRDGGIDWLRGFGTTAVGSEQKVDQETVFAAASLTKPVFAYAVMKLADAGRIELDRPLAEYLAYQDIADDERARKITARMVLSHSTGFPNWRPGRWTDDP